MDVVVVSTRIDFCGVSSANSLVDMRLWRRPLQCQMCTCDVVVFFASLRLRGPSRLCQADTDIAPLLADAKPQEQGERIEYLHASAQR